MAKEEKDKRAKNWTDEETAELLAAWSDDVIQEELEGPRNKDVFEKLSQILKSKGFDRSMVQCRERIKKLKKDYRKTADKQ